ncbi:MAG: hypothetical protein FWE03_01750 [Firmicutes bacterium]|nr:hypothetical protein [Bacillota bacterium]
MADNKKKGGKGYMIVSIILLALGVVFFRWLFVVFPFLIGIPLIGTAGTVLGIILAGLAVLIFVNGITKRNYVFVIVPVILMIVAVFSFTGHLTVSDDLGVRIIVGAVFAVPAVIIFIKGATQVKFKHKTKQTGFKRTFWTIAGQRKGFTISIEMDFNTKQFLIKNKGRIVGMYKFSEIVRVETSNTVDEVTFSTVGFGYMVRYVAPNYTYDNWVKVTACQDGKTKPYLIYRASKDDQTSLYDKIISAAKAGGLTMVSK